MVVVTPMMNCGRRGKGQSRTLPSINNKTWTRIQLIRSISIPEHSTTDSSLFAIIFQLCIYGLWSCWHNCAVSPKNIRSCSDTPFMVSLTSPDTADWDATECQWNSSPRNCLLYPLKIEMHSPTVPSWPYHKERVKRRRTMAQSMDCGHCPPKCPKNKELNRDPFPKRCSAHADRCTHTITLLYIAQHHLSFNCSDHAYQSEYPPVSLCKVLRL